MDHLEPDRSAELNLAMQRRNKSCVEATETEHSGRDLVKLPRSTKGIDVRRHSFFDAQFFPSLFVSLSLSLSSFKPFLISDPHLSTKWDISDLNPSRPDQIGSPRLDGARQKSASEARRWVWPGWA